MIKIYSAVFAGIAMFAGTVCFASDIAREVSGDGGDNFFEVSIGLGAGQNNRVKKEDEHNDSYGVGIGLGWEYRWKGFFSEAIQDSYSGLNLGYELWQNDNWRLDLIGMNLHGSVSNDDEILPGMTEEERNDRLVRRDTITLNGGVRATYYWKDNIIQFRLESDYSQNYAGAQSSLLVGRAWQIRNWNIHGLTGLQWNSRKRNEYLWNVSPLEATEKFPEYQASSSLNYSFEVGATYPISEHWLSRSKIVAFTIDDSVSESPLTNNDNVGGVISTSIVYVF
ncbi:MipA/OmpV family protein [Marinagarivorans cellulosilyticus]|uniref:MipA/OmpV family protein n=1 Tax=Marinagarivorans cellulosilyticus TaxID=2721545 RepID=A0AAN1WLA6_9GAMM|nr:MipA/OmpV family protein [Marinagarivorans cellulosilyticus]BCD99674.1 hypothetical protein MARGE09_P3876 [Marinagarivorans cellulosilyticus]